MSGSEGDLDRAYTHCAQLARAHYENFPVASWMLPAPMRRHVAAVYAFARHADDIADEGERPNQQRLALLDEWEQRLHRSATARGSSGTDGRDLIFVALGNTIRECDLPVQLLADLLSAFRQDVTVHRYKTWEELLDYCRRSANPVGRVVLRIAGLRDEALDARADDVCTALQITNFLQDLGRDWKSGRLYIPSEIYEPCGARQDDLEHASLSAPWRRTLAEVSQRTARLFDRGRTVCDRVGGRLGVELRLTWLGGRRVLARLEESGYDPLRHRPRLTASDFVPMMWQALMWHP